VLDIGSPRFQERFVVRSVAPETVTDLPESLQRLIQTGPSNTRYEVEGGRAYVVQTPEHMPTKGEALIDQAVMFVECLRRGQPTTSSTWT